MIAPGKHVVRDDVVITQYYPKTPFYRTFTDVQSRSADRQNEGAGTEGPASPLEPWL
jgi:hypothetical protein